MKKPKHTDFKEIGPYLRALRKFHQERDRYSFTQLRVAEKCGLDNAQFISNIERGVDMPTPKMAVILSDLYEIDAKIVFEFLKAYKLSRLNQQFEAETRALRESKNES